MLKFTPLNLKNSHKYTELYNQCEEKAVDYTFANLWCWQEKYHFEWAFADDLCWLRHHNQDGELVYNPPIGKWNRDDWAEVLHKHFPKGFDLTRVPDYLTEKLNSVYGNDLQIEDQREHWEYICSIQELTSLNGYRYRNKRKLSNQFKQYYNYIYKKISPDLFPDIEEFQQKWLNQPEVDEQKDMLDLEVENLAVSRFLHDWKLLGSNVFGGVLIVDNKIMAYTLGEKIDDNMIAIHFEKALYAYRGSYQAINRICLENMGNYRFVNREQDLGLEGLRKAKLEYNPVRYIKKSRLIYSPIS